MEIKELTKTIQKVADQYSEEFGVEYSKDWFVMKLQEELGEMVQSHLIMTNRTRRKPESAEKAKEAFAQELADVFCYVILLAEENDINIEQAVKNKWFSYLKD